MKEKWRLLGPFREIINEFYIKNGSGDDEEFLDIFRNTLMPNEINESKSLSSVLNYVHHNMGDNFIVLALLSRAQKSTKTSNLPEE